MQPGSLIAKPWERMRQALGRTAGGAPVGAQRPGVVVVGPVFPQGGGVGMVDYTLLNCGLSDDFDMGLLDTGRGESGEGKEGRLALINFYYYGRQVLRLLGMIALKHPRILHQSLTDGVAFWKESSFMVLAHKLGMKVVAHVHGNQLEVEYRRAGPRVRRLMRAALASADVLVVLSEHWRAFLAEVAPEARIVVVPNSVDPGIAEAMDGQPDGTAREEGMVLFMGGVGVRKGVPDALRAVPLVRQQLPGARFVFAGPMATGQERLVIEEARRAVEKAGGVGFPGLVAGQAKLELLKQASIFILPSYHENFPVAILEAMAMGLPVVSTTVAGIPDVVEDGCNGFLIEPGDYQALADRILKLARDRELREAMGQINVGKVRREYHPRLFAARMQDVYRGLLTGSQPDGAVSPAAGPSAD